MDIQILEILKDVAKADIADYVQIIEKALLEKRIHYNRADKNFVYYESHHILPQSLFPEYEKAIKNKVLLTGQEHYTCHRLLCKIFPGQAMAHAWWRMSYCANGKYIVSADDYAASKEYMARYPIKPKYRPHTDEEKESLRQLMKKSWKTGALNSESHTKGVETRKRDGSYVQTAEQKLRKSVALKGKIFVNNGKINKWIPTEELIDYLTKGWLRGKKPLSEEHRKNIGLAGKNRKR